MRPVNMLRVLSEIVDARKDTSKQFLLDIPNEEKPYELKAIIFGPAETPYENGKFQLNIVYPSDYPYSPIQIKSETPIFHPNIRGDGVICMGILGTTTSK
eukprot:TRINITY_DN1227_c0_g1_i3.p1 TRINITY_DN1227_c0_g1~~TRINITY_DN1227_c0_g1_i3.p1  ORF type:complete len:100 (-),score=7.30 TRINITY_DN1227_c0_g1_i3:185-484(-)